MKTNNCIKNLLKLISVLQDNSMNISCLNDSCTKPFLGPSVLQSCYNTRVITLYNKQGNLFTASFDDNGVSRNSTTFRVQNVDNDCCTLLILDVVDGEYISTRQFITVRLSCICAIKCIEDVSISNL